MLWWLANHPRISRTAIDAINDAEDGNRISAASIWEAEIKRRSGKLVGPDLLTAAREVGIPILNITGTHASTAGSLPLYHRDPFDRMIVAQALTEDIPVITCDPAFARYGVRVIW